MKTMFFVVKYTESFTPEWKCIDFTPGWKMHANKKLPHHVEDKQICPRL